MSVSVCVYKGNEIWEELGNVILPSPECDGIWLYLMASTPWWQWGRDTPKVIPPPLPESYLKQFQPSVQDD